MKTKLLLVRHAAAALLLSTLNFHLSTAFAQGTAFTYQGRLNDGAVPANGSYDFRFRVAMDPFANDYAAPAILTNSVPVANGLFAVALDFGEGVFTGAGRWLEIAVRTNGAGAYTTLSPLQSLTAAPHAIIANSASNLLGSLPANQLSGTLPSAQLAGTYSGAVTLNNAANSFAGGGGGLTNVNASALGGLSASGFWKLSGNSLAPGQFLGSTNNQALEFRANGHRILRLEPDPGGSSGNLIGGYTNNVIEQPGSGGNVIAGGGFNAGINVIRSNSRGNFIGGGSGHQIGPNLNDSFIGGGSYNSIQTNASRSTISGGFSNVIHSAASSSTIGGGFRNRVQAANATVGGGERNAVTAQGATVGGGGGNLASESNATVSGGLNNTASGPASTVAGGAGNAASGDYSFAAGWVAQANHDGAFVWSDFSSGLHFGSTTTNEFAVRATGGVRLVTAGAGLTVDGARVPMPRATPNDSTHSNIFNFVNGSPVNFISNGVYGATISGGGGENYPGYGALANSVRGDFGTVGGGGANEANGLWATVAGGFRNTASADSGCIAGGWDNSIEANATYSFIGSGIYNVISYGAEWSTISGGSFNAIGTNAEAATISGGSGNVIGTNAFAATIGGGSFNAIGSNAAVSTISGGARNTIGAYAHYSTIPGGHRNTADGYTSFAAGFRAKANHPGAFVWADTQQADFASTGDNQFCIRASGGVHITGNVGIGTDAPQTKLHVAGGDFLVGAPSQEWIFHTRSDFGSDFLQITDLDGGTPQWQRGLSIHEGGRVGIGTTTPQQALHVTGNILADGTITPNSDRNLKTDFAPVDAAAVLDKVARLPIQQWRFKAEPNEVKHVGPMAQDFQAAFGLGEIPTAIATVDADGVALAAIQGLNQKVEAENAALRSELTARNADIQMLQQRLTTLEHFLTNRK